MARILPWIRTHLPTRRRLIQWYAALICNAHIGGFAAGSIYTGQSKALCVPGLNCYSCPGAVGACPLGALQNALASSGHRAPFYVFGILMLYGLILGRTVCGFLCPMGLIQDLLHRIPTPKIRKGRATRVLSLLKYVILGVFVVCVPLWYALQDYPLPAFCKYICPAGTLEGAVALLSNSANVDKYSMLGILFTRKFVILVTILLLCVFLYRTFCRFLCPLGAIYGLFSRLALIGVRVDGDKCTDCGRCVGVCKMDIRRVGDRECIQCGECIGACPTKAITIRAGRITLRGPDTAPAAGGAAPDAKKRAHGSGRAVAVRCAALALLVFSLWFFNRDAADAGRSGEALPARETAVVQTTLPGEPEAGTVPKADESIPVGSEIGMRAADFSAAEYFTGKTFTLSEHLGRPVVINFWATWCTPCCHELPYFDEVCRALSDRVDFVALHSNLVTDDVEKYLSGFDYALPFALDADGEVIASFGGSAMLPQTVIVDEKGVIVYNAVGSMTREMLESLLGEMGY